jgi:hypothetical protein
MAYCTDLEDIALPDLYMHELKCKIKTKNKLHVFEKLR